LTRKQSTISVLNTVESGNVSDCYSIHSESGVRW
jgi:hypothetical protein